MKEYETIYSGSKVTGGDFELSKVLHDLDREVNERLQEGWRPQGGVSVLKDGDWLYASQAVVK